MAIDLMGTESCDIAYLIARLACEANVCRNGGGADDMWVEEAFWDLPNGLRVQDGEGRWFRLRVTAEPCAEVPEKERRK